MGRIHGESPTLSPVIRTSTSFRMSDTKPSSELLSSIESADAKSLKGVTTVENPAAKHDMTMFDKNKLKAVETTEKNVLPTADDIKQAKEVEKTQYSKRRLRRRCRRHPWICLSCICRH